MSVQTKAIGLAFSAVVALLLARPYTAEAAVGRCTLQVDGHTYLNGPCNINAEADGSFYIETGDNAATASKWFAYVNLDPDHPGSALGSWNGKPAEKHAGYDLGTLTKRGACWVNLQAKICAMARETKPKGVLIAQQGGAKLELLNVERPSDDSLLDTIRMTLADGRYSDDQMLINCKKHLIYEVGTKTETKINLANGPKSGEGVLYKTWIFSCPSEVK